MTKNSEKYKEKKQNNFTAAKIAILSDIHGNSPALKAVLEDIQKENCTQLYVLGDIINGLDPGGCLELLSELENILYVKGNAEHYLLTPDLDKFPKKDESFFPLLIKRLNWWRQMTPGKFIELIRKMPDYIISDGSFFVHDSPLDRYYPERKRIEGIAEKYQELCYHGNGILPSMNKEGLQEISSFLDSKQLLRLFCGHNHFAFKKEVYGKFICNAGSVGLPLDGNPRAAWVLLDKAAENEEIKIKRVEYDIDKTVNHLYATDAPFECSKKDYEKMLRTGFYWKESVAEWARKTQLPFIKNF